MASKTALLTEVAREEVQTSSGWHPGMHERLISLMPGPGNIHPEIVRAYQSRPVSHRAAAFVETFRNVKQRLAELIPGMAVTIFSGNGTIANDAVAANLRSLFDRKRGLIVSNGEFGDRLRQQASRAGLIYDQINFNWGNPWTRDELKTAVKSCPAWIWAVHLETSTGVVNDVDCLLNLASSCGAFVALDCVSSLGALATTFDLKRLLMVTAVSGKALGAYAGLAIVYVSQECLSFLHNTAVAPSFDLYNMHSLEGPQNTIASSPVFALDAALKHYFGTSVQAQSRYHNQALLGTAVRYMMRDHGLEPIAPEAVASPTVTTFRLPDRNFGKLCESVGYEIVSDYSYLRDRGWSQIATIGDIDFDTVEPLFRALGNTYKK